jgi:hypothetical protein
MNPARIQEAPITQPPDEHPALHVGKLREVRRSDLLFRFLAGALTSVVAGVLTIVFGPRVGGVMLAFPAILAASLTLIEQQEDSHEAREDARGATMGGLAMGAFAAVCALTFSKWNSAVVLGVASAAWLLTALLGYFLAWFRRS